MSGFLENVVIAKRAEVASLRAGSSEADLLSRGRGEPVRDFRSAIGGGGRIIAEIKRRSPSVAAFRQAGPVADLAAIYAAGGASAISIVTDTANFGTSLQDVETVRRAVDLPVLVKDFVIDRIQLLRARASGADAILLIARILERDDLADLLGQATDLGMSVLLECHDAADLRKALAVRAPIIGVNSRNLGTLSVSLDGSETLLARIPPPAIAVAESGIAGPADIARLSAAGAGAFLVGTALLQAADPGRVLAGLLGGRSLS